MWIKICGVTTVENALQVAELGPDAIGLNFYRGSKRCVKLPTATEIVRRLGKDITPVGVFVNSSAEEIRHACAETGITTVQLHGEEPLELVEELTGLKVIRAMRVGNDLTAVNHTLRELHHRNAPLFACLIDSYVPNAFGGTGQTAPWELLAKEWSQPNVKLILSGGLNPANVIEAIRVVRPWGVDVASGVESAPGIKDPDKVRHFITHARHRL